MPGIEDHLSAMRAYHAQAAASLPEILHTHAKRALKTAHETVIQQLGSRPGMLTPGDVADLASALETLANETIQPTPKWPDAKFGYAYTVRAMQMALAREVYLAAARELRSLLDE